MVVTVNQQAAYYSSKYRIILTGLAVVYPSQINSKIRNYSMKISWTLLPETTMTFLISRIAKAESSHFLLLWIFESTQQCDAASCTLMSLNELRVQREPCLQKTLQTDLVWIVTLRCNCMCHVLLSEAERISRHRYRPDRHGVHSRSGPQNKKDWGS